MFFTKLGRIIAALAFALGLLEIAIGLAVATGVIAEPEPGRYLGGRRSGEWIDGGFYRVIFAIMIGIITDISRSVAKDNPVTRD